MSELQKELDRLEENCKKIDCDFDNANEALEYCEKRIEDFKEEIENLDNNANKFNDIINSYDDYKYCLKDYVNSKYGDFFISMVFDIMIYFISMIFIILVSDVKIKILFLFFIIVVSIFNFMIRNKVISIRSNIVSEINKTYNIDLLSLCDEDIDDMEMSLLQSKVRCVNLSKRIEEYEFYLDWKRRKISR